MRTILFVASAVACLVATLAVPAWAQVSDERPMLELADQLRIEAEQLAEDGHPDLARALIEEAERITRAERSELGERNEDLDPEERAIHERLRIMHEEIAQLAEAGHHEVAGAMKRQAAELELELAHRRAGVPRKPRDMPRPPKPDARFYDEQRMQQMRAVIEDLRAAGEDDHAAELERRAAEMERNMRGPRGSEADVEELTRVVQQLQAEVRRLSEIVAQLQERVAQLSE